MNKTAIQRVDILGVSVSAINYQMALSNVARWITKKEKHYVCVAAAHLIVACQKDKNLLEGVNRAGLVTPDGMPLVWLSRLYGHKKVERVYGPTLMEKICRLAERRTWRIFLLGGAGGQSQEVARGLENKFPEIRIVGARDTPVRPIPHLEDITIRNEIEKANPDIVFIGLGCPWQELWMIKNRKHIRAPVLIGVGAAFDFLSGRVHQAPVWIQHAGFEWLFRVIQEPRRLIYRYVVFNFFFIVLTCFQLIKIIYERCFKHTPKLPSGAQQVLSKLFLILLPIVLVALVLELGLRLKHRFTTGQDKYLSTSFETYALTLAPEIIQKAVYSQKIQQVYKPYLLWSAKPNQHTETVSVNSLGLRNKEVSREKKTGTFRIIWLGGSAAWGYGATSSETTIPKYLERALLARTGEANIEVINFAQVGFNSTQEFILWSEILAYKPDLVIHFNGYNDIYTGFLKKPSGWNHPFIQEEILTRDRWTAIRILIIVELNKILNKFYLFRSIMYRLERASRTSFNCEKFTEIQNIAETYNQNMKLVAELAFMEKIPTLFVIQPSLFTEQKKLSLREQKLLDVFQDNYSTCEDVTEYFKEGHRALVLTLQKIIQLAPGLLSYYDGREFFLHTDISVYIDTVHYSDVGNEIVADKLADTISNRWVNKNR